LKKVDSILGAMFKKSSLSKSARLGEIWSSWEKIAGPDIAPHARPIKVVGRRLYVEIDSAPQHHKVSFVKDELLNRVRAFTGGSHIDEIVFKSSSRARGRMTGS
jgi:predicted nucleic acid-binding Zn ribbon protein